MDDLRAISAFISVVRSGGFGAAARTTGIQKPNLSRRVAALEASLGTALFRRTTRQVVLTEAGTAYDDACRQIMASLESAPAKLQAKDQEVQAPSERQPQQELKIHKRKLFES